VVAVFVLAGFGHYCLRVADARNAEAVAALRATHAQATARLAAAHADTIARLTDTHASDLQAQRATLQQEFGQVVDEWDAALTLANDQVAEVQHAPADQEMATLQARAQCAAVNAESAKWRANYCALYVLSQQLAECLVGLEQDVAVEREGNAWFCATYPSCKIEELN
jgi:hypothetical protein